MVIHGFASQNTSGSVVLFAKGHQVAEIAYELKLSGHTINGYIKTIYQKLHISSRAEAALLAQQYGLI